MEDQVIVDRKKLERMEKMLAKREDGEYLYIRVTINRDCFGWPEVTVYELKDKVMQDLVNTETKAICYAKKAEQALIEYKRATEEKLKNVYELKDKVMKATLGSRLRFLFVGRI